MQTEQAERDIERKRGKTVPNETRIECKINCYLRPTTPASNYFTHMGLMEFYGRSLWNHLYTIFHRIVQSQLFIAGPIFKSNFRSLFHRLGSTQHMRPFRRPDICTNSWYVSVQSIHSQRWTDCYLLGAHVFSVRGVYIRIYVSLWVYIVGSVCCVLPFACWYEQHCCVFGVRLFFFLALTLSHSLSLSIPLGVLFMLLVVVGCVLLCVAWFTGNSVLESCIFIQWSFKLQRIRAWFALSSAYSTPENHSHINLITTHSSNERERNEIFTENREQRFFLIHFFLLALLFGSSVFVKAE